MHKTKKRRWRRRVAAAAAVAINRTDNAKLGPVACTYVCQQSCPVTCPLHGAGCYGEHGLVGMISRRLNEAGIGMTPDEIAEQEAAAIAEMRYSSDLRLHVVGDSRTNKAASLVAAAASTFSFPRHKPWTYCHTFMTVDREAWGDVSVLASCHSAAEIEIALARGYAACTIVDTFPNGDAAWSEYTPAGRLTFVPCTYQTKGVQCVDCRLCMDDTRLHENRIVIAFKAHGPKASEVIETLELRR